MATQLILIEASSADWRLDEHTKQLGRQGIAAARKALADAIRRSEQHPTAA